VNKFIISILLFILSLNAHSSFREIWGRYFLAHNIDGGLDLISNFDATLDVNNPNKSYFTLRSLFFYQLGKGWFLDVGPAYRGDFASNINYRELRLIGSIHYIRNTENWNFRNRVRFEKRWINEGPMGEMVNTDPLRVRYRLLIQKNSLINIHERLYAYVGPEFFFEQIEKRSNNIGLGSIRWIFALGFLVTDTLSAEVDYWHRQYVNQDKPNFGSLLIRLDQVF